MLLILLGAIALTVMVFGTRFLFLPDAPSASGRAVLLRPPATGAHPRG